LGQGLPVDDAEDLEGQGLAHYRADPVGESDPC